VQQYQPSQWIDIAAQAATKAVLNVVAELKPKPKAEAQGSRDAHV